jgi:hypothetical protein
MKFIQATLLFILCNFSIHSAFGQAWEKTGKNFGLTLDGGMLYSSEKGSLFKGTPGTSFSAGVTMQKLGVLFPEIKYRYISRAFAPIDTLNTTGMLTHHGVGLSLLTKFYIGAISQNKSKHYECKALLFHVIGGLEYDLNFGAKANADIALKNETYLMAGLGFIPSKSGGAKSVQSWNFHFDFLYQYDLSKNTTLNYYNGEKWKSHCLLMRLTIMKHNVYNFIDIR